MLVNYKEVLRFAPDVQAKKFSRSDKINPDGYCSPYLFAEYPRCKCERKRWGNDDIGLECPTCNAEIYKNNGLGKYSIGKELILLHPAIYSMLKKMKKLLVKTVTKTDINGFPILEDDFDKFLSYKALIEFKTDKERLNYLRELVKTFSSKKVPELLLLFDNVESEGNEQIIFLREIPIMHLKFRVDERGEQSELNKLYGALLRTLETIQESAELQKTLDASLYGVQELLNRVNLHLIDIGALQNYFFPSVSFSSRSPVLSSPLSDDFEGVTIGYQVFKIIYKFRIVHFLKKDYGYTYQNALTEVIYGLEFGSKRFLEILDKIKEEAVMIINRVPSLIMENIIAVKLNDVTLDSVILTPQIVFKYLSQDSDGDVISCIPLFTVEAKEQAMKVFGVRNFLRSKYNFNEFYLSNNVKGYNKYGAFLLEEDYRKRKKGEL